MVLELLRVGLKKRSARQRDRRFLEATMAASALVAYADGQVCFTERMRLDQILSHLNQLRAFDVREAINYFNKVIEDLKAEPEEGHARALESVEAFSQDKASARLMVRAACHLCVADGVFTEGEQEQVAELCVLLDISPEDCELDEIIRSSKEES
jgi:tellurite resistance protein